MEIAIIRTWVGRNRRIFGITNIDKPKPECRPLAQGVEIAEILWCPKLGQSRPVPTSGIRYFWPEAVLQSISQLYDEVLGSSRKGVILAARGACDDDRGAPLHARAPCTTSYFIW